MKGRPRDAGRRQSHWAKVRWNHPGHRRTDGSRAQWCWLIDAELGWKICPYFPTYGQKWGMRKMSPFWPVSAVSPESKDSLFNKVKGHWKSHLEEHSQPNCSWSSRRGGGKWPPRLPVPPTHPCTDCLQSSSQSTTAPSCPTKHPLPIVFIPFLEMDWQNFAKNFIFLFVLKENKSPVIFFYTRDIYIF